MLTTARFSKVAARNAYSSRLCGLQQLLRPLRALQSMRERARGHTVRLRGQPRFLPGFDLHTFDIISFELPQGVNGESGLVEDLYLCQSCIGSMGSGVCFHRISMFI